jgi:ssDNA-binding Zn-finger/Zn-ribbon topoisomerase 1
MSDSEPAESSVVASASAYKQCPQCGFATSVQVQQCPQCGHRYRTQFKAAEETPRKPANKTTTIGCINCGNHDVLKLSAFKDAESDAIAHITPPISPDYTPPGSIKLAAGVGGMFALSLLTLAVTGGGNVLVLILAGILAVGAAATGLFAAQETSAAKKEYERAHTRYDEQIKQWNMLFYCPKCDTVYNLITQKSAPASQVYTLLRRTGPLDH